MGWLEDLLGTGNYDKNFTQEQKTDQYDYNYWNANSGYLSENYFRETVVVNGELSRDSDGNLVVTTQGWGSSTPTFWSAPQNIGGGLFNAGESAVFGILNMGRLTQPLLNTSRGSTALEEEAEYAIKNGKLYASAGMSDMNPYAGGDGESKVGAANRSKIGPDGKVNYKGVGVQELVKANGQWTLAFSSEGNYGDVTLYDENKNVIMSFPATSGRIGVTDRTLENKGPIPLGSYTLDPKEISGGLEKAIERNILLMQDWGFYRVKLNPQGVNTSRGEFFLHGGFFPGSAGCIDIGTKDLELFRLLMQHEGLIKLEVIEGKPNDILFPNGQRNA